jgi:hypothetical protein
VYALTSVTTHGNPTLAIPFLEELDKVKKPFKLNFAKEKDV